MSPLAYRPPGTSVSEIITSQVNSILAANALVGLVGLSQGYQTRTDQFILSGTSAVSLPGLPTGATAQSVVSVKNAINTAAGASDGSGYTLTTDYTVNLSAGTITRVGSGVIPDGAVVNVTYTYVTSDYFTPTLFEDIGSVESKYGSALNSSGTAINSPLSYAATVAFENGAQRVVCAPLLVRATPGDSSTAASQPNATQAATTSSWVDTLTVLRDIPEINLLVPVVGQSQANVNDSAQLAIFQAFQDHVHFMQTEGQYLVVVAAEDSSASSSVAQRATLQSHAATLRSRYNGEEAQKFILLNSAQLPRPLPTTNQTLLVGAQYAAAGIAGMLASSPVSSTITRKILSGFVGLPESRTKAEKNADAQAGLLVLDYKNGSVQIRHGITIDNTATARREISVVRAKHRVIESVYQTLDTQLVAQINADDDAPITIKSAVITTLNDLVTARDIVDFTGVEARLLAQDPVTAQVRFSYRPAFPINNIDILFSLDLTTQEITTTA